MIKEFERYLNSLKYSEIPTPAFRYHKARKARFLV
jgi:hypothetical protein